MVRKKGSKKNITSAMKELEDALLNPKTKKNKTKKRKLPVKKHTRDDILILTDVIEASPYKNMDYRLITIKKNIRNIIKPDIQDWINVNMSGLISDDIKKSLNTIKDKK